MAIHPVNSTPALRLVQPLDAARPTQPAAPEPAARAQDADAFDFEAIYRANLPRPALTEAHRRLEKIRDLVAAKTDVPIHFDPPQPRRTTSPAINAYLKFPAPAPADVNAAAVEQQTGG